MEKHNAKIKEGEEYCSQCDLTPENEIHIDCKKYGDWTNT